MACVALVVLLLYFFPLFFSLFFYFFSFSHSISIDCVVFEVCVCEIVRILPPYLAKIRKGKIKLKMTCDLSD